MNSFPLFLAGFAPGAALGMLSGLHLSRAALRVTGAAVPFRSGVASRSVLILAAFWLGSRFGLAGLLGSFAGALAGFIAIIVVRSRAVSRG